VTIELPWPPSANKHWRNAGGRTLISRQGRQFRELVGLIVRVNRVAIRIHTLYHAVLLIDSGTPWRLLGLGVEGGAVE
jgi:hypothetical protein